jgi:CRP-like cAMP-binding protein
VRLQIVPFVPGRRPTEEDAYPGLGSSDNAALVVRHEEENRATILFEVEGSPKGASVEATLSVDGEALPGWRGKNIDITERTRQQVSFAPNVDLANVDLGVTAGLMREVVVELNLVHDRSTLAHDELTIFACDADLLGLLYKRIIDRLLTQDTAAQAERAGIGDLNVAYHPWFPVLTIGGEKAAIYNEALVADIVQKADYLTDPSWLLRVGVYLELLTCFGIIEAVKAEFGDLLSPDERVAFETSPAFKAIRDRIDPAAWKEVWGLRQIAFPGFGMPKAGPVSLLNLLHKKEATLQFLHAHHRDLRHAVELAGPNTFNAQETWQRVFRDAERAVFRKAADCFPELDYLPAPARGLVMWQRWGFSGQQGLYPTACNQYRASMNEVADWGAKHGLMNHSGSECIPREASLLEAYTHDRRRIPILQRQDGLSPDLTINEPVRDRVPAVREIEDLLREVPILTMMSDEEIHTLALGARPLLLGPTQRLLVQGYAGTSLFVIAEGKVEVRIRKPDGADWLVETMGRGEVLGEMALLTGAMNRSATVRSVDETVVYEISRQQYGPLLKAHPEWVDQLADVMEQRLARRRIRAAAERDRHDSLVERIRRNFFA